MKRTILTACLVLLLGNIDVVAQTMNPEFYHGDIEAGIGIQGVPNSNNGVDLRLDLSYGCFFNNGIGFRAGMTYTPRMLDYGKAMGFPISFAWRTFQLDRSYSVDTIDYSNYNPDYMLHQDYSQYVVEQLAMGLAGFLTQIASNIEIDAGVTPGYLKGRNAESFYLTGDIGLRTSWRVWRFNFSVNPAMHYLLTNKINMGGYKVPLSSHDRWQLSLMFGISFML